MKSAEFEEREYEAPLYNQLTSLDSRVWAPGQVFEGYVGIDYALFFEDPWLFDLHGLSPLRGALLSRYRWPRNWFRRRTRRRLPNFRLNLFLQAKRPEWGTRPRKEVRDKGLNGLYWRISLNDEQHNALEKIAARLAGRALVLYAAPAFHEYKDLFRHTRLGTIAANSTFPSVSALRGHDSWFYNQPGATGVANPDYIEITEPPLADRLSAFVREFNGDDEQWRANLKYLAQNIRAALSEEELAETPRRASFFELLAEIERESRFIAEEEVFTAYLSTLAFCETYLVEWYVLGSGSPANSP